MAAVLRISARLAVAALAFGLVLWVCGWLLRPAPRVGPPAYTPEQAAAAEQAREVTFDPDHTPSLHVQAVVKPTGQSPILKDLQDAGKLPPLAQRLPDEPIVMRGADGIGQYGGTWLRLANAPDDVQIIANRLSGAYLVRWSPLGYPIEPHIAQSVEPSDDMRVWTVTLRQGMKWSDGQPYTADDILYWWDAETLNGYTGKGVLPQWMQIGGTQGRVEKVDDTHVRFVFEKSYPLFRETLCSVVEPTNTPAHYLRKYHPDPAIGDKELIARDMKAYKVASPRALYSFMKAWQNPEHPRLWPWIYRTAKGDPPQVFVRNPYYFVVDEAGNQLPYIDRLQFDVIDGKLLALTAANGGTSMQARHIRFPDYTELVSRTRQAGTRVLNWYPATRSNWLINPNLNRRVDPDDPASQFKADLLADKHFRQALSLAIDRKKIIKAEQVGLGEPSQIEPGPLSPFHSPALQRAFVDHDPKRANELLDGLGLTKRDGEGFRTFADGSRMTFYLDFTAYTGIGPSQFVVDDWADVGVRCVPRERTRPLFYTEKDALTFDFNCWSSESDFLPLQSPRVFLPVNTESFYASGWARWYSRGGFYGNPNAAIAGCIPVPKDHPMYQSIALYEQAIQTTDKQKQIELMDRVMDIAAENVWTINIASPPPALVVVDADLRNVPRTALFANIVSTPANAGIETYYFEHPKTSAGAVNEVKQSILTPTLRPGPRAKGGGGWGDGLVRILMIAVPVLLISLLALRHPYIGRRLVIMVPTLAVISVIVFVLVQAPPGDFLATQVMQLQENGDPANEQKIKDLREMFHFEEPQWKLYARWIGAKWFTSFSGADEGLLQGNLGRSMDTQQPINSMVGDRITLTVCVSLATIVFTWIVALPIGIYSAVRQYSMGDYVLTLVGFIGMCVPAFLLALVLIAVSGMSGLFSPDFAAQPEWTWPKVIDLIKHIWIPVIVLGVGGTAGMIRVMRANLLDELKKPYVTTAMAKGVRPLKLLIKYPVRLALNPFVSGIGHLFPQLISGGAIVAMVLSLPMIGPLQLTAVMAQDTYMAGSMLMVLSLLGVVGTLVSDLLLLWLDPRIRFDEGGR